MEIFGDKQKRDLENFVDNGGNIALYFAKIDPLCSDIDSKIKRGDKIGQGNFGGIFPIENHPRLVVKEINAAMATVTLSDARAAEVSKECKRNLPGGKSLNLPAFLVKGCLKDSYRELNTGEIVSLPKNSMICSSEQTEFVIGLWVGEFYTSGRSINFFPMFYFATCADCAKGSAKYYMFMEQIDTTFKDVLMDPDTSESTINHLIVQTLHAIATYQHYGKIVHGDLHAGNIFLTEVTDALRYNGVELANIDYYEYKIRGESIFLPGPRKDKRAASFIAKVGDYGFAVKYSPPLLGDMKIITDYYGGKKPNWYNQSYDVLAIFRSAYLGLPQRKNKYNEVIPPRNVSLLTRIVAWMHGLSPSANRETILDKIVETANPFPLTGVKSFPDPKLLGSVFAHVNPVDILLNKSLLGPRVQPTGNILLIGEIP